VQGADPQPPDEERLFSGALEEIRMGYKKLPG
jgi:hypothetical protein